MYIVAIAWLYVVVLMAATESSVLAGISTLVFYGLLPCAIVMYLLMAPTRAKRRKAAELLERDKHEHEAAGRASDLDSNLNSKQESKP